MLDLSMIRRRREIRHGRALIAGAAATLALAASLEARAQASPDTPSSPPPPPGYAPSPGFEQRPAPPIAPTGANSQAPTEVPPSPPASALPAPVEAPPAGSPGYAATVPALSTAATVAPEPSYGSANSPPPAADVDSGPKRFSHGQQFIYLNVETGFERVGLRSLNTSNLLPETVDSSASAPFFGVGGGVQLSVLTLGPRFRTASFDAWSVWTLDLEATIHLPLGRVEPYFIFAGGYAHLDPHNIEGVSIHGYNARVGIGIDVFATKNITIGASGTGEVIGMSRSGNNLTTTPQAQAAACAAIADPVQKQQCATNALYAADGSALGVAGTLAFVAGLHF